MATATYDGTDCDLEGAQSQLEHVLQTLDANGLAFRNPPTIARSSRANADAAYTIFPASYSIVTDFHLLFPPAHARSIWHDGFHVPLSDAALHEWGQVQAEVLAHAWCDDHQSFEDDENVDEQTNVVYLGTSFFSLTPKIQRAVLFHDAWHLLESERNVLDNHRLISEGTAMSAEEFGGIYGRTFKTDGWPTWHNMLYNCAHELVSRWRRENSLGHDALLDPQHRRTLESLFLEELGEFRGTVFPRKLDSPVYRRHEAFVALRHPIFASTLADPSIANIANTYAAMGAEQFAKEIIDTSNGRVEVYHRGVAHQAKLIDTVNEPEQ